jgi:curved DNA-binding protein CbpA
MDKDYYRILGVLDDAEDIVIRAAYRALAQRYHPDKWTGSKEEGNHRMSEINTAYSVLSDPDKRKWYDDNVKDSNRYESKSDVKDSNDIHMNNPYYYDMKTAIIIYPELQNIEKQLIEIDSSLRDIFRTYLFAIKNFDSITAIQKIADFVKIEFLKKYFGTNMELITFGEELILEKNKPAASFLNELVFRLGVNLPAERVIEAVCERFPSKRTLELKNQKKISKWANTLHSDKNYHNAYYFLESIGFNVKVINDKTWGKMWSVNDGGKDWRFQSEYTFIEYAVSQLKDYKA